MKSELLILCIDIPDTIRMNNYVELQANYLYVQNSFKLLQAIKIFIKNIVQREIGKMTVKMYMIRDQSEFMTRGGVGVCRGGVFIFGLKI